MTRSEAYAEGFHTGRKWAEEDIADGTGAWMEADLREMHRHVPYRDYWKAILIGQARGYRDTFARYEAGTLTRQMFEHAPRGGTR